jgi:hypothetical protein
MEVEKDNGLLTEDPGIPRDRLTASFGLNEHLEISQRF